MPHGHRHRNRTIGSLAVLAAAAGVWLITADDIPEPPPRPSPEHGFFGTPRRVLDELRHERRSPAPPQATAGREAETSRASGRTGLSRPGP